MSIHTVYNRKVFRDTRKVLRDCAKDANTSIADTAKKILAGGPHSVMDFYNQMKQVSK